MAPTALDHLSLGGRIDWVASLDTAYNPEKNYRRTSIICTIGMSTSGRSLVFLHGDNRGLSSAHRP